MSSYRRVKFCFDSKSLLQIYVFLKDYEKLEECLRTQEYDVNNGNYFMSFLEIENPFAGWTPLHVSAYTNDMKSTRLLLSYGADINAKTSKYLYTPLHIAIRSQNREVFQLLVEFKADLNAKDGHKNTALELSLGDHNITDILVDSGVRFENKYMEGLPLIFKAMDEKNLSLVRFLAKQQMRGVFFKNKFPIEYAIDVFPECVPHLIESGRQLYFPNSETGEYPIHLAIRSKQYLWIKKLCEMDCDTNVGNRNGNRPLHIAVQNDCPKEILLLLLSFGANPNLKNQMGLTPIFYAIEKGNAELTEMFMQMETRLSRNLSELERSIRFKKFKTTLILLNYIKAIESGIKFESDPIIWFFLRHCVGEHDSDANDLTTILQKLIVMTSDINTVDNVWGSLMHFLIYADVCAPTHCFKPLFNVLIRSHKYEINYEFKPKDTRSKTGEEVPVERIMANGTALSFALEMPNCEYYAEQLIKIGADHSTINWDHIFFAPKKTRALKMLIYSGCNIPEYFREDANPLFDESVSNDMMNTYCKQFDNFVKWWDSREITALTLKQIARSAVRRTMDSMALRQLMTNGPQVFSPEFETFPRVLSDYILYEF